MQGVELDTGNLIMSCAHAYQRGGGGYSSKHSL